MRLPRPDGTAALIAAIGALGASLVLLRVATPYGPGTAIESALFVAAARNLLAGNGLVTINGGEWIRDAMPGFPAALAFAGRLTGLDPLDAAGYLNAAAFGLTILVTAAWARSRTRSRFLAVWSAAACALSARLAADASTAMTDPLFILFATSSLYALDRRLSGGGAGALLAAAGCAALACATRWIGLALVASALPLLLLAGGRGFRPRPRAAGSAAIFAAVALAPSAAWAARNAVAFGRPVGTLAETGFSPQTVLHLATGEFARWTLGEDGFAILGRAAETLLGVPLGGEPSAGAVLVQAAALLVLLAGAAAAVVRMRGDGAVGAGLAVPVAFLACYGLALAVVLPRSDANLHPRYLAPMYPPLLVAAAIVLGGLLRRASARGPRVRLPGAAALGGGGPTASLPALALAAALVLWLPQQAFAAGDDIRRWRAAGYGWTSRERTESGLASWLRSHPPEGRVWSNRTRELYLPARLRLVHYLTGDADADRRRMAEERAAGGEAWVAWLHDGAERTYGVADLPARLGVEVVAVLDNGVVFRAAPSPQSPGGALLAGELLGGARPIARSGFDVHLDEERRRLVLVRGDCGAEEASAFAPFFAEAHPADAADPPGDRRKRDFARLEFPFASYGFVEDGRCVAARDLPDYRLAAVVAGQRRPGGGEAWSVRVPLGEAAPAATLDVEALRARAEPLAAAPFEVLRDGRRLVYVREACAAADVEARFFLHVRPSNPADLPEDRRAIGFDNLDFGFRDRDYVFEEGGRCVAVRSLPAYPIASIRTGQWVRGEGESWAAEAAFGE